MAYQQQAGRANVESAAINYLTDGDKKKKKKEGKSSTTTTSVSGVTNPDFPDSKRKGTLYTTTVTTTYDGTSGKKNPGKPGQPFNNPALPNQTYKEFINAPEGSPGKPVKPTKTPDTPGKSSSVSTTRFKPDDLPPVTRMKPYGIKTQTILPTAPIIKPLGTRVNIPKYYHHSGSNAANMKFGGHTTTSNTTSPDGDFQASYTNSPSRTISGKSNTTSSVPFTQAQNLAMFAGFPMGQSAPPSDEVANAFVNKKREKVLTRANNKYNKRYNKQ
jgi:hypothetical protein